MARSSAPCLSVPGKRKTVADKEVVSTRKTFSAPVSVLTHHVHMAKGNNAQQKNKKKPKKDKKK